MPKQQDMRITTRVFSLLLVGLLLLFACCNEENCRDIYGNWNDREGHAFVFKNDGTALWLNKFGQMVDTIDFVFSINCKTSPASIDFKDFDNGPFAGKTLFGIIEWSADSVFRICYEVGHQQDIRPKQFDSEQTMKFFR
jgi:hypothetical protein